MFCQKSKGEEEIEDRSILRVGLKFWLWWYSSLVKFWWRIESALEGLDTDRTPRWQSLCLSHCLLLTHSSASTNTMTLSHILAELPTSCPHTIPQASALISFSSLTPFLCSCYSSQTLNFTPPPFYSMVCCPPPNSSGLQCAPVRYIPKPMLHIVRLLRLIVRLCSGQVMRSVPLISKQPGASDLCANENCLPVFKYEHIFCVC